MEIKKVYATSKGMFWSKEEAEKRKNRARDAEASYRNGEGVYEKVREVYVLVVASATIWPEIVDTDIMVFELKPVEIQ